MGPSENQRRAFREQGYFHLGPVFGADDLAEIRAEYDAIIERSPMRIGEDGKQPFQYSPLLHLQSPALLKHAASPVLVETAMALLDCDVRLYWDQAVSKPPGASSDVPWHQDNGYAPVTPAEYVTFTVAIDASDEDNGCLWIQPHSHRRGVVPHASTGGFFYRGDDRGESGVPVPQPQGDVLAFSSLTLHRSGGNESPRPRRSWVIQMCHVDAHNEQTGERYDDRLRLSRERRRLPEPERERDLDLQALARGYTGGR